jgi:hypothetical protein
VLLRHAELTDQFGIAQVELALFALDRLRCRGGHWKTTQQKIPITPSNSGVMAMNISQFFSVIIWSFDLSSCPRG